MQYTKLGNSQLQVSRICMGCMGFGTTLQNGQHSRPTIDEEHAREIIRQGLEQGINFFDTAIAYQSGTSEQYLGRALRDFAKREEVVVATKFLPRTPEEIAAGITGQQHVEQMIDTSLKNLGLDYVDLYIYHMWDYATPLYDILDGLNRVVKKGKARYIGISNCFAYQLAKANSLAEREGFAPFISVQGHYNLIFREEEREMAKLCAEDNIATDAIQRLGRRAACQTPGRDFQTAGRRQLCQVQIRCHRRARQHHPPKSGGAGRQTGRLDDRDLPCLAADQGDCPGGGGHEATAHPRGRQSGRSGFDAGRDRLSGRTLSPPQAGGRHGSETPRQPPRNPMSGPPAAEKIQRG